MNKLLASLLILGIVCFSVAVVAAMRSATRQNKGPIARFFWVPLVILVVFIAATLALVAYHMARHP